MMYEADALNDLDQLRSRYDVLRVLGHDGPFVVYAVRIRDSDRHFAVKVMDHPDARSANPAALHAWQAHTVERLDHPKIMLLHAVHHLQGGAVAMAMERRRGHTLAEHLEETGPLPLPEVESTLRDIAEALTYLHGRGIVHRGIRPHSIFVERDNGHARLAHFGIEKGGERSAAAANAMLATLAYLAPEQIEGETPVDGRAVNVRTDIFSLGLVGYAMLTGSLPWQADDQASLLEKRGEPLPPLSSARADAPAHLVEAIEGCLDPNSRRRWRSAEEFLVRLASVVEEPAEQPAAVSSGLRTRAANGVAALRAALGERLSAATRGRLILVGPGAAIGLVALGVIQSTDDSADPALESPPTASAPVVEGPSEERPQVSIQPRAESVPLEWEPFRPESVASLGASPPGVQVETVPLDGTPVVAPPSDPAGTDEPAQTNPARRPSPNAGRSSDVADSPPLRTVPQGNPRSAPPAEPDRGPRDDEPAIRLPAQRFVSSSPAPVTVDLLGEPIVRPSTFSLLGDPVRSDPRR